MGQILVLNENQLEREITRSILSEGLECGSADCRCAPI